MFGRPVIKARRKKIGKHVKFGKNVKITGFKGKPIEYLEIGDDCTFHDGVEIHVSDSCIIGYGNMFHNNVHMIGDGNLFIGNQNWIGERTLLDATGGLSIGCHNTIGVACQIWSHVVRPLSTYTPGKNITPEIDKRKSTRIVHHCWLMGGNIQVSPGVTIAVGSIIYSNAVVSKDTEPFSTYAGIPAKKIKGTVKKTKGA